MAKIINKNSLREREREEWVRERESRERERETFQVRKVGMFESCIVFTFMKIES